MESVNGTKVNLISIAIWVVTGKLFIVLVFDSFLLMFAAALLVGVPFVLFARKSCVRYRLADTT